MFMASKERIAQNEAREDWGPDHEEQWRPCEKYL